MSRQRQTDWFTSSRATHTAKKATILRMWSSRSRQRNSWTLVIMLENILDRTSNLSVTRPHLLGVSSTKQGKRQGKVGRTKTEINFESTDSCEFRKLLQPWILHSNIHHTKQKIRNNCISAQHSIQLNQTDRITTLCNWILDILTVPRQFGLAVTPPPF